MPPSALHLCARRYHLQGVSPKIWMQQVISKADHFDLVLLSLRQHQLLGLLCVCDDALFVRLASSH